MTMNSHAQRKLANDTRREVRWAEERAARYETMTDDEVRAEQAYAEKISGLTLRMPSADTTREITTAKDVDAFAKLRREGQQPKRFQGIAEIVNRAESSEDVLAPLKQEAS